MRRLHDSFYFVEEADRVATLNALMGPNGGAKTYRALLTQSGTGAPTAVVLENTLGGTVVWTRDDMGTYIATLADAFTDNKTFASGTAISGAAVSYTWSDASNAYFFTSNVSALADSLLTKSPVEIIVYS